MIHPSRQVFYSNKICDKDIATTSTSPSITFNSLMYKATCSPKHITRYEGDQKTHTKTKHQTNQPKSTKEKEKEID